MIGKTTFGIYKVSGSEYSMGLNLKNMTFVNFIEKKFIQILGFSCNIQWIYWKKNSFDKMKENFKIFSGVIQKHFEIIVNL